MLLTSVGWANSYYMVDCEPGQGYTDEWGVQWRAAEYQTKFGKGKYTEMVGHPLAEDFAIDSYKAPDPNRPELYTEAERVIKPTRTNTGLSVLLSPQCGRRRGRYEATSEC